MQLLLGKAGEGRYNGERGRISGIVEGESQLRQAVSAPAKACYRAVLSICRLVISANSPFCVQIFIGGLAYNTSRYDICEMFGPIGPIVDISLPQVDKSIPADSDGEWL